MLSSIYASKLYRSSPRKDKIRAAFDNPINSELVGQLAKALDDEYKKPEFLVKEREPDKEVQTEAAPEVAEPSGDVNMPLGGGGHGPSAPPPPSEGGEPEEQTSEDPSAESSAEPAPDAGADAGSADAGEAAPVAEATQVPGGRIVGSQIRTEFADMRQVADQVKGLLNFKDSTKGVNRILTKENEFWVYYNDDVNLNNVMAEVIELLNASNYTYLEFNRLARSDNAIVFQIDFATSDRQIKPIGSSEDKKK